jgi:transcriptional regulator with GAF, ATPase, and Fis domain
MPAMRDSGSVVRMSSRLSLLVELSTVLSHEIDLDALLERACERVRLALDCERVTVWLVDGSTQTLVGKVAQDADVPELRLAFGEGLAGHVAATGTSVCIDDVTRDARFKKSVDQMTGYATRSVVAAPIAESLGKPLRGVLQLLNHNSGKFADADREYAEAIAVQLARIFQHTTLRPQHTEKPGITLRGPFNHIVGCSAAMQAIYPTIARAAQHDVTVLLCGETGTGKGLFARALHVNSPRASKPFVTLDCTLLNPALADSQLFGHERGAFTGAEKRVCGKLELAQGGTLFLDEIGDLSLELQAKLLRVLQERRYERVGGQETLQADVRIIAATHRDLEAAVRAGTFRQDLFYRIKVLSIQVPSLRARGADEVVRLAEHFRAYYTARYSKSVLGISNTALAYLTAHQWPGNVRELEHWVESAVVLADSNSIELPGAPSAVVAAATGPSERATTQDEFSLPLGLTLDAVANAYARATLASLDDNRTETAKQLGIGRSTLLRMLSGQDANTDNQR